jgi:hypothetical protein
VRVEGSLGVIIHLELIKNILDMKPDRAFFYFERYCDFPIFTPACYKFQYFKLTHTQGFFVVVELYTMTISISIDSMRFTLSYTMSEIAPVKSPRSLFHHQTRSPGSCYKQNVLFRHDDWHTNRD